MPRARKPNPARPGQKRVCRACLRGSDLVLCAVRSTAPCERCGKGPCDGAVVMPDARSVHAPRQAVRPVSKVPARFMTRAGCPLHVEHVEARESELHAYRNTAPLIAPDVAAPACVTRYRRKVSTL